VQCAALLCSDTRVLLSVLAMVGGRLFTGAADRLPDLAGRVET